MHPLLLSLFTTFVVSAAVPPFPPLSGGPAAPSAVPPLPAPWARAGDDAPSAASPGSTIHPLLALAAGAVAPPPERGGAQPRSLAVQYEPGGWQVGTLAGSCAASGWLEGSGSQARFNGPKGIAVDAAGNAFVVDSGNNAVRKITPDGGVSTFAVSTGAVSFNQPVGIALSTGGDLFVGDQLNHRVCKVAPNGAVSVFAGSGAAGWVDGSGAVAKFWSPEGVAVDAAGNVFVGDSANNRIRVITPSGAASTVAGSAAGGFSNGCGTAASFSYPSGVAVDAAGDVYVADSFNLAVRKVQFGCVTTLAGGVDQGWSDGAGASASFQPLYGVAVDAAGNVFVADYTNGAVRKVSPGGFVTTVAGGGSRSCTDGYGTGAKFNLPYGVAVDPSGNVLVTDWRNHNIRVMALPFVASATGTGTPSSSATGTGTPSRTGTPTPTPTPSRTPSRTRSLTATPTFAPPSSPSVTPSATPSIASAATTAPPSGWLVTTLAGSGARAWLDGQGAAASFSYPFGVAIDAAGNAIVGDYSNNRVRRVTPGGAVSTLAGVGSQGASNGVGTAASFKLPCGVAVLASGVIIVADAFNNLIRTVAPSGTVATLAGSVAGGSSNGVGTAAGFNWPYGVAADPIGNAIVADSWNNAIRKVTPSGAVTTVAGGAAAAWADGVGSAARFSMPAGVAVDAAGTIFVADTSNHRVRAVAPDGAVSTLAGSGSGAWADGTGALASFFNPYGVAVDASGIVYVADYSNHRVRRVAPSGAVTTVAGNGTGTWADGVGAASSFFNPSGIALNGASGGLLVADYSNNRVRALRLPAAAGTSTQAATQTGAPSAAASAPPTLTATGTAAASGPSSFTASAVAAATGSGTATASPPATASASATAPASLAPTASSTASGDAGILSPTQTLSPTGTTPPSDTALPSDSLYILSESSTPTAHPTNTAAQTPTASSLLPLNSAASPSASPLLPPGAPCAPSVPHACAAAGACRGGFCCSAAAAALGCAACLPGTGSCVLFSPGEPCASAADCGTNLCAGGCCCASSALLAPGCSACACLTNASTTAATAGVCAAGGGGGGGAAAAAVSYHTHNYAAGANVVVNTCGAPTPRCHACEAFDASAQVDGLFILPGANPLNPTPGVDLAVGLPGSCASLAGAAAAQGVPPAEVAAMLPCLARPAFLLIDGTNFTVLGPAAPLKLAALPEDCGAN